MGFGSIWHWVIVLVIVLLVFGTRRLTSGAKDVGKAIGEFKKGMRESDDKPAQLSDQNAANTGSEQKQRDDSNTPR
jgi:sec-independent protein translocase protein TatA